MTHAYFYFLIFFTTALIISAAALKFAAYLSFKLFGRRKQTVKNDGYAGGFYILSSVTSRFPVRFAFIALLFVLFNAEFLLLLPWAMSLRLSEEQGGVTALLVVIFGASATFMNTKKGRWNGNKAKRLAGQTAKTGICRRDFPGFGVLGVRAGGIRHAGFNGVLFLFCANVSIRHGTRV